MWRQPHRIFWWVLPCIPVPDAFFPLQARPVSAKDAPKASVSENAGALKAQINVEYTWN